MVEFFSPEEAGILGIFLSSSSRFHSSWSFREASWILEGKRREEEDIEGVDKQAQSDYLLSKSNFNASTFAPPLES